MNLKQAITNPYIPPQRPVLVSGRNGLPKLIMRAADGARAEVYLHGGQLASWVPADGVERLFVSDCAEFRERNSIRGGAPVIFPQVGADGRLPPDGFAHRMDWGLERAALEPDGRATATLRLTDTRASWALWRHRFSLDLRISVGGASLDAELTVSNDGRKPFRCAAMLQSYLRLSEGLDHLRLLGLEGRNCLDRRTGGDAADAVFTLDPVAGCDRLYPNVSGPLLLRDGGRTLQLTARRPLDVGIWCPSAEEAAALPDLDVDERERFVRLTAGIAEPVWLQPGDRRQVAVTLLADEPPLLPAR